MLLINNKAFRRFRPFLTITTLISILILIISESYRFNQFRSETFHQQVFVIEQQDVDGQQQQQQQQQHQYGIGNTTNINNNNNNESMTLSSSSLSSYTSSWFSSLSSLLWKHNVDVGATTVTTTTTTTTTIKESCALCFFGLPRSFQLLVLPSIVKNILIPNIPNGCDIYFHYYNIQSEPSGRSGKGGTINATEVYLLRDELYKLYNNSNTTTTNPQNVQPPHISFTMDTNEMFWNKRKIQIDKYLTTKDKRGKYLYFPWKEISYKHPSTIENIIKQWHSIDRAWYDMEKHNNQQLFRNMKKNYTRIAMLRNDVIYVTPFDIYKIDNHKKLDKNGNDTDTKLFLNQKVIIPNWGKYPINDRMIYGPYEAVKIWSTERFTRLEDYVLNLPKDETGFVMHSERYLKHSIFKAIQKELNITIYENPDICFFRSRADGSTQISDCTAAGEARGFRTMDKKKLVESIIGRTCQEPIQSGITSLPCKP